MDFQNELEQAKQEAERIIQLQAERAMLRAALISEHKAKMGMTKDLEDVINLRQRLVALQQQVDQLLQWRDRDREIIHSLLNQYNDLVYRGGLEINGHE